MLGVSGMLGNSGGDGGATAAASAAGGVRESGGSGSDGGGCGGGGETGGIGPNSGGFSEEEKVRGEEVDRSWGGNRWPRQETLALLQIRSDMDVAFRDSSLKGPLWEEVSRKLAELGYHRSAKKCKEKFENVYKYHRRTKEVRASKQDGKSYRFFDQLEALENQAPPPSPPSILPPPPHPPRSQTYHVTAAIPLAAVAMPATTNPPNPIISQFTVPSTANPTSVSQNQNVATPTTNRTNPPPSNPFPAPAPVSTLANPINLPNYHSGIPSSNQNMSANLAAMSTSSSTSSDDEPERLREKKRKWVGFFQKLMSEVIEKQEEMQKKFLETLEKRERERVAREEAWRAQEMARMNREHDLLVHERSIAAAKDAAVIAFLQKVSEPQIPNAVAQIQMQAQVNSMPPPPPPPPPALQSQSQPPLQPPPPPPLQLPPQKSLDNPKTDNGGENFIPTNSSRWPKVEVQALIRTRTNMDFKYQENGPKGPLWEDISAAMRKLGYDRSAKRCKEKWENINKYFKKVKESNKKRPEDSKTCPYFQQLEALYKEKAKNENNSPFNSEFATKPENSMVPIMVQPEQQWPLLQEHHRRPETAAMGVEDDDSENTEQNHDDDDDEDDENEEDEAAGYEIVTKKPSSVGAVE